MLIKRYNVSESTIRNYVDHYFLELSKAKPFPDIIKKDKKKPGPESFLTEELIFCILEYNVMEGFDQNITDFTLGFNKAYGENFSRQLMESILEGLVLRTIILILSLNYLLYSVQIDLDLL